MSKLKVVVQDENGCRILTNPDPSDYIDKCHLIDPDTSRLRGVSPSYWRIVGEKVVSSYEGCLPKVEGVPALEREMARVKSKLKSVPRLIRAIQRELPRPKVPSLWAKKNVISLIVFATTAAVLGSCLTLIASSIILK